MKKSRGFSLRITLWPGDKNVEPPKFEMKKKGGREKCERFHFAESDLSCIVRAAGELTPT